MARSGKRPYTRDELQDLFDCADDQVMRIRAGGSKGWIPADRMATIMKTAYAWGLRRNEVRSLDLVDLAVNPGARQFRQFGILYVRHGKAMRGSPPKRRSVLTVPGFDWVCDCLQQWIEDVRPRYAPTRSTDL
jgi:integrase